MRLRQSRKCILFLEPMARFSTLLAIMPNYSFRNRRLTNRYAFKCYSLFLAGLMISASFITLYYRQQIYHKESDQLFVLGVLYETGGLATFLVTTLGASFWNMNTWEELINQLGHLENANNLNTRGLLSKSVLRNSNFILLMSSVYFVGIYTFQTVFITSWTIYYTSTLALYYFECVIANIMFNILLSIKEKYKRLHRLFTSITLCNTFDGDLSKTIKKVRRLYLKLDEVVETFNKLFGWPLLLLLAHSIVQALDCLTSLIITGYNYWNINGVLLSVGYGIGVTFGPVMVIFCCDLATKEPKKLLRSCFKLEQYLPVSSLDNQELTRLKNLLESQRPVFTAAGFFQISRSTLLFLISTITTYFIVAIQFQSL